MSAPKSAAEALQEAKKARVGAKNDDNCANCAWNSIA